MVCGLRLVIENWNVAEAAAGCAEIDPGKPVLSFDGARSGGGTVSGKLRILILEDSADDAALMEGVLRKAGLDFTAQTVRTRDEFLNAIKDSAPGHCAGGSQCCRRSTAKRR